MIDKIDKIEEYYIIAFNSTNQAILSEKLLIDKNIDVKIIPLPTHITASCGLSLKIELNELKKVSNLLKQNNIVFDIYFVIKDRFKKNIKKI